MDSEPSVAPRGVGRVAGAIRRYLPAIAVVLSVVLVVSDWPLGWSLWLDHPFIAALVAGLVLLLLTGSVVDVILRRREARRWLDLGRGAAYALDQVFFLSGIAMVQVLGVGGGTRLSPEIEFHVAPARERAAALFPAGNALDVMVEYNEGGSSTLRHDRLPVLLRDSQWRDHALLTILALARAQETDHRSLDRTPPTEPSSSASRLAPRRRASRSPVARCGPGVHGTATSHRGGTLRVVTPYPFSTVDPAVAYDPLTPQVLTVTNDGLVDFRRVGGARGASLVPNLAVGLPKPSDGGATYAFRVREGIRYSTGEAVRAEDFRRAIERVFSVPTTPSSIRLLFSGVRGADACGASAKACNLSEGIVTDDATGRVAFHLSAPDPEFLYKLTLTAAYPVPAGTPNRDVGASPIPATGPYMIEEYVRGKRLTLVRNPHFRVWSSAAQPDGNVDRISMTSAVPEADAVTAVAEGRADFFMNLRPPSRDLAELTMRYPAQVHRVSEPRTDFLVLNTRVPPFDDVGVRRALNYAIDRAAVVDAYGGPAHAKATCQVLPPNFPGYAPYCPYTANAGQKRSWSAPDLDKAKALVQESGTAGMRVEVFAPAGETEWVLAAREAVAALDRLGYRASLRSLDTDIDTYFARISDSRNSVQAAMSAWVQDYPAAGEFIASQLSCEAFAPDDSNSNFSGFCDHAIDAMVERGRRLQPTDPAFANELFAQVDRAVTDRAPYVPLVNPMAFDFVSARVGNAQHHPQWRLLLDQLWVR